MPFVRNNLNNITSGAANGPRAYAYQSTDTLTLTTAVGYFDDADVLKVGDLVQINGTDNYALYFVVQTGFNTSLKLAQLGSAGAYIAAAGQRTTVGGTATEEFLVTGALSTDLGFVQVVNAGTNDVTVLQVVVANGTLTVTFSGNPAGDTVVNYQLLRAQ